MLQIIFCNPRANHVGYSAFLDSESGIGIGPLSPFFKIDDSFVGAG